MTFSGLHSPFVFLMVVLSECGAETAVAFVVFWLAFPGLLPAAESNRLQWRCGAGMHAEGRARVLECKGASTSSVLGMRWVAVRRQAEGCGASALPMPRSFCSVGGYRNLGGTRRLKDDVVVDLLEHGVLEGGAGGGLAWGFHGLQVLRLEGYRRQGFGRVAEAVRTRR